jgi:hypothetical protein
MQSIIDWFNRFTMASHITYAGVVAFVAALYTAYLNVPAVQTLFQSIYAATPGWVQLILAAVVGWYAWYRNGETPEQKIVEGSAAFRMKAAVPTVAIGKKK